MRSRIPHLAALLAMLLPALSWAEPQGIPAVTVTTDDAGNPSYSVTLQILILMTMLTFLPAIVMMMTSFTGNTFQHL